MANERGAWKVGVFGDDPLLQVLLQCAAASRRVELVGCYGGSAAWAGKWGSGTGAGHGANLAGGWEGLLDRAQIDAAFVGRAPREPQLREEHAEQLRRLTQAGIPLLVVHPACDMLLAYELDMIRADTACLIFPFERQFWDPAIRSQLGILPRADLDGPPQDARNVEENGGAHDAALRRGSGEQIEFLRTLRGPVDRERIMGALACDSLLLRWLLGEVTTVAATGVTPEGQTWGQLSLFLTGSQGGTARWSVREMREPHDVPGASLTWRQNGRTESLALPGDEDVAAGALAAAERYLESVLPELDGSLSAPLPSTASTDHDSADTLGSRIPTAAQANGLSWQDVCRSAEIMDAVERSIQRRRTIELYHEQVTEEETFKSVMAAGGCLLLLWVLGGLLVGGLVEGLQLPLRDMAIWRLYPLLLVGPLALFMALQLLKFLFPRRTS